MNVKIEPPDFQSDFPFFRLSSNHDLVLFLIQKELQGTKFTNELEKLGFDGSTFSTDLGSVILSLTGFRHRSDELWEWYYKMVDAFTDQVDLQDHATAREAALHVYLELRNRLKAEAAG